VVTFNSIDPVIMILAMQTGSSVIFKPMKKDTIVESELTSNVDDFTRTFEQFDHLYCHVF
jgi:hypothetical protein